MKEKGTKKKVVSSSMAKVMRNPLNKDTWGTSKGGLCPRFREGVF